MLRLVIHIICLSTVSLHSDFTPSLLNPHPAAPRAGRLAVVAQPLHAEPTSPCCRAPWRLAGSPTAPAARTRHLGRHNQDPGTQHLLSIHVSVKLGYPLAKPWVKMGPLPLWMAAIIFRKSSLLPSLLLNQSQLDKRSINQFDSLDRTSQTVLELVSFRWFNSRLPFLL